MIQLHGLHVAVNFLGFWAQCMFSGLLAARIWLVPEEAFSLPELSARWRHMLLESFSLMAFSGVALLLIRIGEMDEGTLARVLSDLPMVLAKTHFGHVWSLHLALILMLWGGVTVMLPLMPARRWAAVMGAITVMLAFTYSASSHASDGGDFTLLEMNDWAHIVSTSVWGGGILVCALLVLPQLQGKVALVSTAVGRLSALSAAALLVVLSTGFYNASRQLPTWDAIFETDYGRILAVKLAMVGLLIIVGAFNRYVIAARLRRHAPGDGAEPVALLRLLFRLLAADAVLVGLTLVMAAILIQNEAR